MMIRKAKLEDAEAIQNLILLYTENGTMLYRSLDDIRGNIFTFLVCEMEGMVAGVCSLKYGWDKLVEIRSLAVHPRYYRRGIGTALVRKCVEESLTGDCDTIFVLTYAKDLFTKLGFEVVEKDTLPQKVWNDCQACLHKENCDETAMTLSLNLLKSGALRKIPLNNSGKVLY